MFSSLAIAVLLMAVVELFVLVVVAKSAGTLLSVLLLVALSAIGVVIVRFQGAGAMRSAGDSIRLGQVPGSSEVADRSLRLLAGGLIVIPGFVSGGLGLLLLFHPVRSLFRPVLASRAGSWIEPTLRFRRNIVDVDEARPDSSNETQPRLP